MSKLKIVVPSHVEYNIATNTCKNLDSNWKITKMGDDPARETIILISRLTGKKNKSDAKSDKMYADYYFSTSSFIRIEPKGYEDSKLMKFAGTGWVFKGDKATCPKMNYHHAYLLEE